MEDIKTVLREKRIYNVYFDSVMPSSNNPSDDYYSETVYYDGGDVGGNDRDELIYYDGGGVEGYGD